MSWDAYWERRKARQIEQESWQEWMRLQHRVQHSEPEVEIEAPDWPFVLTKDDERFLKINRIAK